MGRAVSLSFILPNNDCGGLTACRIFYILNPARVNIDSKFVLSTALM
jgi:hypothetical protein